MVKELALMENNPSVRPVLVKLGPYSAFVLIAALQVTYRHPDVSPTLRAVIRQICDKLRDYFGPDVQRIIEMGWDTKNDVPSSFWYSNN